MKFNKILITSCAVMALGATGASFAQIYCPDPTACSSSSAASCLKLSSNWQVPPPMSTIQKGDNFAFIYAYYKDGTAQCAYKRASDNSITLSTQATNLVPASSSGWPTTPTISGGARTCGSATNPQSTSSCPWQAK